MSLVWNSELAGDIHVSQLSKYRREDQRDCPCCGKSSSLVFDDDAETMECTGCGLVTDEMGYVVVMGHG